MKVVIDPMRDNLFYWDEDHNPDTHPDDFEQITDGEDLLFLSEVWEEKGLLRIGKPTEYYRRKQ